ncbi:adenylate cyclase [Microtetraspora sp. NBRC 13810]|nr:adenylate cyclase [Microtetraspora sp. NBRC 13810]
MERICANAPDLLRWPALDIHVIDPYPPGGGRVWRSDQPGLLWMNSTAADVTLFTDESVACAGPIVKGPSLAEWLGGDPGLFAPRPVQNAYLSYVFDRTVATAPRGVRIHVHAARAVSLADLPEGQRIGLDDGRVLDVDAVVLAQGHGDVTPARAEQEDAAFARRNGLLYLPTGYAADLPLDRVPAGQPVLVRGMGLAFVDLMVLLTAGRGGRFTREYDGELVYLPSGAEPLLHVGSRRGVPYHAKTGYTLAGGRPREPRFLTPGAPAELVRKELAFAYYRELITAHGERCKMRWAEFEDAYADLDWGSAEMRALIRRAVPKPADRLDFDRLDRPLHQIRFGDHAGLQRWMHGYLAADLRRRADPAHSADLALIYALISAHGVLTEPDPWFRSFFSYIASGPPGQRLEEMLALARAGVVTFLGAGTHVERRADGWRAVSRSVPGGVEAAALIDARLPAPSVSRATDPLIAGLYATGGCEEEAGLLKVRPEDRRLVGRDGAAHPRRFAFGPWVVAGRGTAGFARPGLNAPLFRGADALARTVLSEAVATEARRVA